MSAISGSHTMRAKSKWRAALFYTRIEACLVIELQHRALDTKQLECFEVSVVSVSVSVSVSGSPRLASPR
jgi:hypothetical protein